MNTVLRIVLVGIIVLGVFALALGTVHPVLAASGGPPAGNGSGVDTPYGPPGDSGPGSGNGGEGWGGSEGNKGPNAP